MQQRHWLAVSMLLLGVGGGVVLWRVPLILRSGAALPTGPDTFAHDDYLSIPAGLPVAGLAILGSALVLASGRREAAT